MMDHIVTVGVSDSERFTATAHVWLAACLAAPPWRVPGRPDAPGTPALWAELLSVALRRAWPRDGAMEAVRAARELARVVGASAAPEIEGARLSYTTVTGTLIVADLARGYVSVAGEARAVLRRALAAEEEVARLVRWSEPDASEPDALPARYSTAEDEEDYAG